MPWDLCPCHNTSNPARPPCPTPQSISTPVTPGLWGFQFLEMGRWGWSSQTFCCQILPCSCTAAMLSWAVAMLGGSSLVFECPLVSLGPSNRPCHVLLQRKGGLTPGPDQRPS